MDGRGPKGRGGEESRAEVDGRSIGGQMAHLIDPGEGLTRLRIVVNITTFEFDMEKAISAAEANRKFSQLLREVREGRTYVVTSHGRPVARIAPVEEHGRREAKAKLLAHLRDQPIRTVGGWKREELYD